MAEHTATDEGRGCTGINAIDQHTATDLNESIQKKTEATMSSTSLSPGGDSIKEYMQLSGQRLTGLFFSGRYEDRVLVEPLNAYRDRVVVDDYQTDVIKTLKTIHRKAKKAVPHFDGIQRNDTELSLLANWSTAPPLGHFWLLVDSVTFHKAGFDLRIRVLRRIDNTDGSAVCPNCSSNGDISSSFTPPTSELNVSEIAANLQRQFQAFFAPDEWWARSKPYLTAENFVRCVKLILLLGLAALSGLYHLACNFLPAVNKTLLALGTLIQKATPFLMACLDTINKIIGATFLMIHRIWTDFYHGPRSQPPPRPTIKALDMPGTRYWSRQSVSERENLTSGNLYLEGQQTSGERPRYPYLRRDVNRPYMRE